MKKKKYAIRVVFQVREDPDVHSPVWVIDALFLKVSNKQAYTNFDDCIARSI